MYLDSDHSLRRYLRFTLAQTRRARCQLAFALFAVFALPSFVRADIDCFCDFDGWELNQSDGGPAPTISADAIRITNRSGSSQTRSLFYSDRQSIDKGFLATFTYRAENAAGGSSYGAAFILHNDVNGIQEIGSFGDGLGYVGIRDSAAVTLQLVNSTGGVSHSGLYFNGSISGSSDPLGAINLYSGNPIDVIIAFDGRHLTSTFLDTVSLATSESTQLVDLVDYLGDTKAFVGLSASTFSGTSSANQHFSNFHFEIVPEPSSIATIIVGTIALAATGFARRRRAVQRQRQISLNNE